MDISSFKHTYQNTSLDNVVSGLTQGLRADIPYPDSQIFSKARLTADVVKNGAIALFDKECSGLDTVELIMELENGVLGILEPNYDSAAENGAGIVAVLSV
ncbi:MAG TPA: hypothetical protein VGK25_07735 [Ignavibacteria bacterium]|jgi:hypothetical protein